MSERESDAIDRREKGFLEEIRRLARPSMPRSVQNFLWAAGIAGLFLPVSILVLVCVVEDPATGVFLFICHVPGLGVCGRGDCASFAVG